MPEPIADLDAFRAELRRALAEYPGSQKELADELEMSEQALTDWKNGRVKKFDPAQILALEAALGCVPGRLTSHLGYVPLRAVGTVQAAILASALDVESRRILLDLYERLRGDDESSGHGTDDVP